MSIKAFSLTNLQEKIMATIPKDQKPLVNVSTEKSMKQLTWLWATMKAKFPNLWIERNTSNFCDENGEFTPIAKNWLSEIKTLSSEQVRIGLRDLSFRKNPEFPPTAIEFVSHCRKMGAQECADEILDYINQPSETAWWWKTKVAFNVFKRLRYSKLSNEGTAILTARVFEIYQKLDMDNLDPLPPAPIALPNLEPSKVQTTRGKFQAKMFSAIMRARPDLLGEVQEDKTAIQDKDTVNLFTPHKSNELMIKWAQKGEPDMCQFLRNNGIAV